MSFMLHPSRPNGVVFSAVAKGLGINQTTVNPVWECKSYSKNITYFKAGDVTLQELRVSRQAEACK